MVWQGARGMVAMEDTRAVWGRGTEKHISQKLDLGNWEPFLCRQVCHRKGKREELYHPRIYSEKIHHHRLDNNKRVSISLSPCPRHRPLIWPVYHYTQCPRRAPSPQTPSNYMYIHVHTVFTTRPAPINSTPNTYGKYIYPISRIPVAFQGKKEKAKIKK